MFNQIIKISINLLVFLLPLFWLPFSFEVFEFNKQYLLFFLTIIAFFAWLGKMVLVDQEVRFKKTPLDLFVLGFLFLAILSAIFSVNQGSSIFGFYGRFSDGLLGLLSLGVWYFLITNNVKPQITADELPITTDRKSAKISQKSVAISVSGLIKTLMWSVSLVILISYFSIFGVLAKIGSWLALPQLMRQNTFNPVSGSLEGLAIFLAIVMVFLIGRILTKSQIPNPKSQTTSKFQSLVNYVLLFASLGLLIIIDFSSAWWILLTSLVLFLAFALWKRLFKENVNRLLLPIFLIVAAGLGLATNFSALGGSALGGQLPQEQVLGKAISWQIGFKSATDNVKSVFLGSGIGTFHYDFAKEKPMSFNQERLWQIRFDRSGSYFSELLATMGFLGLLSWLAIIGMFLLLSHFLLQADSKQLPLLMLFVALLVGQFFYYQNTVLGFAFWLVLGLAVVGWQKPIKEKVFSFKSFPELNLVFTTILIIAGMGVLGTIFFGAKFYLADRAFQLGLFEKAVKLNPYQSQYWTILARVYLQDAVGDISQEKVARAIDAAKTAVLRGPGEVAAWETQGMVYRDIRQVAGGAQEWAIKSFERAIELEPTNPVLRTELAKVYIPDNLAKAKEELAKAISLKPDYTDALYQEALIQGAEGNSDGAIKTMESLVLSNPFNAELRFQLGRLYYNNNQLNDSIAILETVLQISSNHSNALYSLAVAWQKKGNKEKAKSYFEKVLELNPDNQEVKNRLKELEAGNAKK